MSEIALMQIEVYQQKLKDKAARRSRALSVRGLVRGEARSAQIFKVITQSENGYKMTNAEIGAAVGISTRQVATHVKRLIDYGMLTSTVRFIPGFTGHPLAFRELRLAIPKSEERIEDHVESGIRLAESHPANPKNLQ